VKPVFADTFYRIALTSPAEAAYDSANQVTDDIVTIDEVLTEYLTFFSSASDYLRRKTANNVQKILRDPGVHVIPQAVNRFSPASIFTPAVPAKAIASQIAFRCRPCGAKA
jgi:hypothetical protein